MMLVYDNNSGQLWQDGIRIATGYSGTGVGLNDPRFQFVRNVGPIPVGVYRIGKTYESVKVGPLAIPLIPLDDFQTGGRSGFVIHGDNPKGDRSASQGCIVLSRNVRERIVASAVKGLVVIDAG